MPCLLLSVDMTAKKLIKTTEPKSRSKPAIYDEQWAVQQWREAAGQQADPTTRERLVRLADQLQQIMWRRGDFRARPTVVKRVRP